MLGIELRFPAGRYHANPWGRNINEGDVEWPPSPYRLIRCLIDVWKRRWPELDKERFKAVMNALSGAPRYCLPEAATGHIRTFQSSNQKDPSAKQLIFDAFVAMAKNSRLLIGLESQPDNTTAADLNNLLQEINFLGRSESWIKASLIELPENIEWNCWPVGHGSGNTSTEQLQVACLMPWEIFRKLELPKAFSWEDAVCLSTQDFLREGWNQPPAIDWTAYEIKPGILNATRPRQRRNGYLPFTRSLKYALSSSVLPHIKDTIGFAEKIRQKVMGIHKNVLGGNPQLVSKRFSGKNADGKPLVDHVHVFYLPLDEDNDNRIDHLLITAKEGFDESELIALDKLQSVWQSGGKPDVKLILTEISGSRTYKCSKTWVSVTPFVTSRHYRRGRGSLQQWLNSEIARECKFHSLPQPTNISWIPWTVNGPHPIRWMQFMRGKRDERPFRGNGCILTFEKPVQGPFALGSRSHFGLGLFQPMPGTSQ